MLKRNHALRCIAMWSALSTAMMSASSSSARAEAHVASALSTFLSPFSKGRVLDQDGQVIAVEALGGNVVVVTFFDVDCTILCVNRLTDLATVLRGLPDAERGRVRVLALNGDGARPAPEALQAFAAAAKLEAATITLAAGEPSAAATVLAGIGWRPDGAGPDRVPPTVFVFDREGAFAMRYAAAPVDKRRLGQDLAALADLDHGVGQGVAEVSSLQ